jgi:hypothetical protein
MSALNSLNIINSEQVTRYRSWCLPRSQSSGMVLILVFHWARLVTERKQRALFQKDNKLHKERRLRSGICSVTQWTTKGNITYLPLVSCYNLHHAIAFSQFTHCHYFLSPCKCLNSEMYLQSQKKNLNMEPLSQAQVYCGNKNSGNKNCGSYCGTPMSCMDHMC